jgi:thermitase
MLLLAVALLLVPSTARAAGDPVLGSQWGLESIRAEQAWVRTTGAGVRIGIVDTGVDMDHEELAGKVVADTTCVGSAGNPRACHGRGGDDDGHGTHVAGVAVAYKDNGKGGAGVAPDAELVVAKVFSSANVSSAKAATGEDIVAGIKWVVDHGARVVNLSLGDPDMAFASSLPSTNLRQGLDYAWTHGAVPVLAAGRYERLGVNLADPSSNDLHAIVVGATTSDGTMASYSAPTGAARLAVLAPGGAGTGDRQGDVYSSTWARGRHNAYAVRSGTSIAAAHVSGAVALLLAEGYNGPGAVERLLATSDGTVSCGTESPSCWGRIDAVRATDGPVVPAHA